MNPQVFREYDVRGIVGEDLDHDFVYDLGRAIGTYGKARNVKTMTIGRDCRLSSEEYLKTVTEGLLSTGIDVIDIGLCATPILYYSIRHLQADGGIMVTGSHNPPEFNGFKICIGSDTIYGKDIQELKSIMQNNRYVSGNGTTEQKNIAADYQDYIFNNVKVKKGLKVIVDAGNGVGGFFALPLFERFGCDTTPLYCDMDGHFPNHFPDPTVEENLPELIRLMKEKKADIGIAYDGDADRIGVITNEGKIVRGDELLLLFSRFILKENPGAAIIGEVKCSQILYDDVKKNGGRGIMWKAGHSLIKGKMKEEHALLAGEMSGHIFFADRYFGYDDAIYASARLLEILSLTGQKLSQILSDVPHAFNTPEIRVDCPDDLKFKVVEKVKKRFEANYDVIDTDGVRVQLEDGWGLVRASNTQPILVLRFESKTEEGLKTIKTLVEGALKESMG
ncbi:MAG: phosphomannomutase/phosphoglucomutase [Thermodesulfobacteriota bacterium]|nr:phosphomannomutase/phosphoglucomutase [Thermodesulfobacteriota bacterium]